jgi:stage IV sporulation protein FA
MAQSGFPSGGMRWAEKWESDYLRGAGMMTEDSSTGQTWDGWSAPPRHSGGREPARVRKWLIQGIFSLALVACVWLIETSTHPQMAPVQAWMTEALKRDFNFAEVSSWYEEQFQSSPSFLPVFAANWLGFSAKSQDEEWTALAGQVAKPFSPQHQGILLNAPAGGMVTVVGTGWVVDVSERPGLGLTVVVQHPRGKQTWYAKLRDASVAKEDWVYPGDSIGRVDSDGQWFFAVRQGKVFIDPESVITIE